MPGLTTSWAPPDAAPEMTLISLPPDVCQALIAGLGPTYAASSWPASSAVDSSVPVLNGVSFRVTPFPRFLVKKPSLMPTRAGAWVTLARKPSFSVTDPEEDPDEPDEPEPEEPHAAARTVMAATPAAISTLLILRL